MKNKKLKIWVEVSLEPDMETNPGRKGSLSGVSRVSLKHTVASESISDVVRIHRPNQLIEDK